MIRVVEESGRRRAYASVKEGSGPIRVVTDQPDPDFKPRPVGFTAQLEPVEPEVTTTEEITTP